jgi:hypothetical protein
MDNNKQNMVMPDQLDALVQNHTKVLTPDESPPIENATVGTFANSVFDEPTMPSVPDYPVTDSSIPNLDAPPVSIQTNEVIPTFVDPLDIDDDEEDDDIDYGDNDVQMSMDAEDAILEQQRLAAIEAAKKNEEPKVKMPPNSLKDRKFVDDAVGHQEKVLAEVTIMISHVVQKYRLFSGGIPDINPENGMTKMMVQGDLIEVYHNMKDGDPIPPIFEEIILKNWRLADGSVPNPADPTMNAGGETEAGGHIKEVSINKEPEEPTARIEINAMHGNDVTVNIDGDTVAEMTKSRKLEIHVKEVTTQQILGTTLITDSMKPGIIKEWASDVGDTSLILPMSGYRCVMKSPNMMNVIRLTSPINKNLSDNERRKWSVLFRHARNFSVGEFVDEKDKDGNIQITGFEKFLKGTAHQDRELMMWGILCALADDQEEVVVRCENPRCRSYIPMKYFPRQIINLNDNMNEKRKKILKRTESVAAGPEAVKLWNEIIGARDVFKLPESGYLIELKDPTAYEFIYEKLPLIEKLYRRYRPDEEDLTGMMQAGEDPELTEFEYASANAMFIESFSIVVPDPNNPDKTIEYRYTNWDDIESLFSEKLGMTDSTALLNLIEKYREEKLTPYSFYLKDVKCPRCHNVIEEYPIHDIAHSLLFQMSQRLQNTEITLIAEPLNSCQQLT